MVFKYSATRQTEEVVRKSKQSSGGYDSWLSPDATFLKIDEGQNEIRILPPTWALDFRDLLAEGLDNGLGRDKAMAAAAKKYPEQAEEFKRWGDGWEITVFIHRNVGPDNGTYLCLDKMLGEPCPVCEARRDADEEEADKLKVQSRIVAWIIDRKRASAGPQVGSLPLTLTRDINGRSVDKKSSGVILIDDPYEGYDVTFTREGSDLRTKYTQVDISRDPSPVSDDKKKMEQWLQFIEDHPLPELLVYHDAEHIEKVLFGKTERRGKDKEEVEEARATSRSSRRAPAAEPDEEPEATARSSRRARAADPEPESEPEPEAETPRRSRRAPPPEEEVEAETEAEPEETPRRRGRAAPEASAEEPEDANGGLTRRRGRSAPPDEAEDETPEPSTQARGKLAGMRERRAARG